jgi:DinB family protein
LEFGAFNVKRASALKAKPVRLFMRPACRGQAVENQELAAKLVSCPNAALESRAVFTKAGIAELHGAMHERLDLLLGHFATVPDSLHHRPIPGFGHSSIWKQLVHILTCEEGWVHDLQDKTFAGWHEKDCPTMTAMLAAKARTSEATRTYLNNLSEEQFKATLAKRPLDWGGELRSPAFTWLHLIT